MDISLTRSPTRYSTSELARLAAIGAPLPSSSGQTTLPTLPSVSTLPSAVTTLPSVSTLPSAVTLPSVATLPRGRATLPPLPQIPEISSFIPGVKGTSMRLPLISEPSSSSGLPMLPLISEPPPSGGLQLSVPMPGRGKMRTLPTRGRPPIGGAKLEKQREIEILRRGNIGEISELLNSTDASELLILAIKKAPSQVVQFLLDIGADVNYQGKPLAKAIKKLRPDVVQMLLDYGADFNREVNDLLEDINEIQMIISREEPE